MKSFLLSGLLLFPCMVAHAATINAASQSVSDVQAAINSASNGDTITVPAGSATWNSGVTIDNSKGITLDGTGVTITRGSTTGKLITIVTNATTTTRVTGWSIKESTTDYMIYVSGGFPNAKFRIDHATLTSTANSAGLILVANSWGVIDHCTITGDEASEMIHNEAWGAGVTSGWNEVITPGSIDALYIEDCTFTKYNQADQYFWGTAALQSYYGARTVFRYNTLNYCHVDQHGTPGNIGARWWEIYENTFHIPAGGNQANLIALRGGSGVAFNNRITGGPNLGSGSIELYEEDTGYPALYQVGRGKDQVLDPAYLWGNGVLPAATSSNVVDGRDFYSNTQKPGYTPLTYPHPLAATVVVQPPSNATVQAVVH